MVSIGSKIRVITDWLLAEGMIVDLMESAIPSKIKKYLPSKHYIYINKFLLNISQTTLPTPKIRTVYID